MGRMTSPVLRRASLHANNRPANLLYCRTTEMFTHELPNVVNQRHCSCDEVMDKAIDFTMSL